MKINKGQIRNINILIIKYNKINYNNKIDLVINEFTNIIKKSIPCLIVVYFNSLYYIPQSF